MYSVYKYTPLYTLNYSADHPTLENRYSIILQNYILITNLILTQFRIHIHIHIFCTRPTTVSKVQEPFPGPVARTNEVNFLYLYMDLPSR